MGNNEIKPFLTRTKAAELLLLMISTEPVNITEDQKNSIKLALADLLKAAKKEQGLEGKGGVK